ncbi:MAG: acetyl-CoA hydrolase/transferase family protein, partial [Synergistetes bacterium]|nr:acetyl-CoA hydrolase/transferase family protein [Synergistota bacterium]
SLIEDGMTIACSGFTPAGYPKAVPLALAERVKRGEALKVNLWTGASVGPELDEALASAGAIKRRLPYQTDDLLRSKINSGEIDYIDIHLSQCPQIARYGFLGKVDFAIIEAVAINEEGGIIPSTSVGNSPTFVKMARKVIVEINTVQPLELEGMHDIYIPEDPPSRREIPIYKPDDRIGLSYIPCDPEKIEAIVLSDIPDNQRPFDPVDDISKRMAENLIDFLRFEIKSGRLPKNLLPLQSGVGSVANAVLAGFLDSEFNDLYVYTEVIQDSMLELMDAGKLKFASGTSLTLSPSALRKFYDGVSKYKNRIVLRPQEISNHPEVIRRLGVIAMNTAIEVDIYGHVNSTNLLGSRMMNGIGGSGDFSRNAYLSIFQTPSTAKGGAISKIVPMVSHVDHTEHEVHLIVTEWGVADLRGKSPRERAKEIIGKCAHPDYREMLWDYFERASRRGGHEPHLLEAALSWHVRLIREGSMRT